jgi:hypothetical protein
VLRNCPRICQAEHWNGLEGILCGRGQEPGHERRRGLRGASDQVPEIEEERAP